MKKLTIGLSVAALTLAGVALATPGQRGDADNDGTLTRAEAQAHATTRFAKMDANKDGKLDTADREARQNAMFDRIDTNKDGQISRQEFAAGRDRGGPGAEQAGQAPDGKHRMGHRDGRGWGGPGGPGGPRGDMMQLADTNKDGAISQSEFTAASLQHFDRTDANKDGQVTKEERHAAFKSMRDQGPSRNAPPVPPPAPAPAN